MIHESIEFEHAPEGSRDVGETWAERVQYNGNVAVAAYNFEVTSGRTIAIEVGSRRLVVKCYGGVH